MVKKSLRDRFLAKQPLYLFVTGRWPSLANFLEINDREGSIDAV